MIALNIPPQALHNAFHVENALDLRDMALCGTGTEVLWLLAPVCVVAENMPASKRVADGVPTRLEFGPQTIGQS